MASGDHPPSWKLFCRIPTTSAGVSLCLCLCVCVCACVRVVAGEMVPVVLRAESLHTAGFQDLVKLKLPRD